MFYPCFAETNNKNKWIKLLYKQNEIVIVCDLIICFRVHQNAITIENWNGFKLIK